MSLEFIGASWKRGAYWRSGVAVDRGDAMEITGRRCLLLGITCLLVFDAWGPG